MRAYLGVAALVRCHIFLVLTVTAFAQELTSLDKAVKDGKVSVEITGLGGSTGDSIQLTVRRKVSDQLRLSLPMGTVFGSASGGIQNMVAARVKGELVSQDSYRLLSLIHI